MSQPFLKTATTLGVVLLSAALTACGGSSSGDGRIVTGNPAIDQSVAPPDNTTSNPVPTGNGNTSTITQTGTDTTTQTTQSTTQPSNTDQTSTASGNNTSNVTQTNTTNITQTGNGTTAQISSGSGPTTTVNFSAAVTEAPADGATVSGTVRIVVSGSSIENVELLPSIGYTPILGVFNVAADKTMAWLDFDTRTLPNGTLTVRISAYNRTAGSVGAIEVSAMTGRKWLLRNDSPPMPTQIPPASYMPEVLIAFGNLPYVDPQPLITMVQQDDTAFEAMLKSDWPRVEKTMYQYVPSNVVLDYPTPLGFYGPWYGCLQSHTLPACREGMNYMIGFMQSKGA